MVDHTERSYTYPIVADPTWNYRWFGGEIIFNRNETIAIATGGAGAGGSILAGCGWIPAAGQIICGALGVALGLNASYFAAMYAGGKCGKYFVYFTSVPPPFSPAPQGQSQGQVGCPRG
ncbi:hypothetical protein [Plantactinospora sp. WMMB782]|uniref:hypothetical protein n=1 Tax=Plantactinospora sp. WMMB782 TaxID=3404121 RepID=UPI003B95909A